MNLSMASCSEILLFSISAFICSSVGGLIPRDVSVTLQQRLPGGLEPDDWSIALSVFQAIKEALPDAGNRQPGEVMQFVADAIHAHRAPMIEQKSLVPND